MKAYVWTLSWFDSQTEHLVGDVTFDGLSDDLVASILGVPVSEVLGGEFEIDPERARRFEIATGFRPALNEFIYQFGATAV
jgi:hypothetical protein